jgi:hypothetical protein
MNQIVDFKSLLLFLRGVVDGKTKGTSKSEIYQNGDPGEPFDIVEIKTVEPNYG